jgi:xanthine/uracil permease
MITHGTVYARLLEVQCAGLMGSSTALVVAFAPRLDARRVTRLVSIALLIGAVATILLGGVRL